MLTLEFGEKVWKISHLENKFFVAVSSQQRQHKVFCRIQPTYNDIVNMFSGTYTQQERKDRENLCNSK